MSRSSSKCAETKFGPALDSNDEYEDDFESEHEYSDEGFEKEENDGNAKPSRLDPEGAKKDAGEKNNVVVSAVAQTKQCGVLWKHVSPEELELGQLIGGGGFAVVYEGYWRGRHVAMKTLFDPRVSDKLKQEFMDELHVMSALSHPNIVELLAANTKPPKLVIVMELCDRSLAQLLHQTQEDLSQEVLVGLAADIASGLHYLHTRDPAIIHRDIKSPNISSCSVKDFFSTSLCIDAFIGEPGAVILFKILFASSSSII